MFYLVHTYSVQRVSILKQQNRRKYKIGDTAHFQYQLILCRVVGSQSKIRDSHDRAPTQCRATQIIRTYGQYGNSNSPKRKCKFNNLEPGHKHEPWYPDLKPELPP